MQRSIFHTALVLCFALAACAGPSASSRDHLEGQARIANVDEEGLAIQGYDPLSYFPEGGGRARKGSSDFTATHDGITYAFASAAHRASFLEDPERYMPAYGGWCAWAMAKKRASRVQIDPESFTLEQGRLFLFYDSWTADTRKSWLKQGGAPGLSSKADRNWRKFQLP